MDLSGIISIAGKPGLYKVVAQGKNNVIVESLEDKKRFPAHASNRISALEDISIYTADEDTSLKDVFTALFKKESGKASISHKEDPKKLGKYFEEVLPNYDKERVYPSDIKKFFQWYNLLQKADLLKLEEKKAPKATKKEEATEEKTAKKTTEKGKATPKKAVAKSPVAAKAAPKTGKSVGKAAPAKKNIYCTT